MKTILALAAAVIAISGVSPAHADTNRISGLDVAAYKAAVEAGCRDQGRRLRHSWAQVGSRCKCVVETLNSRLTPEEWKRATFFAQQRNEQDEAIVLAPHMAALKACEKGAAGK